MMVCIETATEHEARGLVLRRAARPALPLPSGDAEDRLRNGSEILPGFSIYRAVTAEDLHAARDFLCRWRRRLGYLAPAARAAWRVTGARREVAVFLARSWPDIVGTATLIVDSWDRAIPAGRIFPEVGALRSRGRLLCEVTDRAMVPAYYRTSAPHELLRCAIAHGLFVGCTDLVISARPWEVEQFGVLGFERLGALRSSGGTVPEPRALVRLDLTALDQESPSSGLPEHTERVFLRRHYVRSNPFRGYVRRWAKAAEEGLRRAG